MNVIQQAAIRFGCPAFCENLSGSRLLCMNPVLCTLPVKYILVNYILNVRCKTIYYSSASGMEHVEAIAEQRSQEGFFCFLFLFCGVV